MPDGIEQIISKRSIPTWAMPLVSGAVSILVAVSAYINAHTTRVESQSQGHHQESFEDNLITARASDESVINEVQERCFQNDRMLRYYSQLLEMNLYRMFISTLPEDAEVPDWTPAEFPALGEMEEEHIETLGDKLRDAYSDDELMEAIRLIELGREL